MFSYTTGPRTLQIGYRVVCFLAKSAPQTVTIWSPSRLLSYNREPQAVTNWSPGMMTMMIIMLMIMVMMMMIIITIIIIIISPEHVNSLS